MDGMLLQTVEALRDSPFVSPMGQSWELLQAEKEEVSREILSEASLLKETDAALDAYEPSEESTRAIQWHYREALEDRLRAINDAQDRLLDGGYGVCLDCGQQIGGKRIRRLRCVSLARSRSKKDCSLKLIK